MLDYTQAQTENNLYGLYILHLKCYMMICKSHQILKDVCLCKIIQRIVTNEEDEILELFSSTKGFNNTKNAHPHCRTANISGQWQICKKAQSMK